MRTDSQPWRGWQAPPACVGGSTLLAPGWPWFPPSMWPFDTGVLTSASPPSWPLPLSTQRETPGEGDSVLHLRTLSAQRPLWATVLFADPASQPLLLQLVRQTQWGGRSEGIRPSVSYNRFQWVVSPHPPTHTQAPVRKWKVSSRK